MADKIVLMDSRKAFFLEYVMAFIAIAILLAISIKGLQVNRILIIIVGIAAILGLSMPEIKRIREK